MLPHASLCSKPHSTLSKAAQELRNTKPVFKEIITDGARVNTVRNTEDI